MNSISPAVAEAFRSLRSDLYEYLDQADCLADKAAVWSGQDIRSARELIPDLVLVIRGLLGEHEAHSSGVCQICASAWPCPVVTTVHELIKDPQRRFVSLVGRAGGNTEA